MNATLHKHTIVEPREAESAESFARLAELVQRYLGCEAAVLSVDDPFSPLRRRAGAGAIADRCVNAAFRQGREFAEAEIGTLANPLAASAKGMRFYAGLPLRDYQGRSIGMLAAMDPHTRDLATEELQTLKLLAGMASDLYEMQRLRHAA